MCRRFSPSAGRCRGRKKNEGQTGGERRRIARGAGKAGSGDAAPPGRGGTGGGKQSFPRCGKLASMVWKNGKSGFHGVEVFQKLASMAWKNGEFGFHGVEDFWGDASPCGGGGERRNDEATKRRERGGWWGDGGREGREFREDRWQSMAVEGQSKRGEGGRRNGRGKTRRREGCGRGARGWFQRGGNGGAEARRGEGKRGGAMFFLWQGGGDARVGGQFATPPGIWPCPPAGNLGLKNQA